MRHLSSIKTTINQSPVAFVNKILFISSTSLHLESWLVGIIVVGHFIKIALSKLSLRRWFLWKPSSSHILHSRDQGRYQFIPNIYWFHLESLDHQREVGKFLPKINHFLSILSKAMKWMINGRSIRLSYLESLPLGGVIALVHSLSGYGHLTGWLYSLRAFLFALKYRDACWNEFYQMIIKKVEGEGYKVEI